MIVAASRCNIDTSGHPFTPAALSYTLVGADRALLYISPRAVPDEVRKALESDGIELRPYLQIYDDMGRLPEGSSLMLDEATVNVALLSAIPENVRKVIKPNPTRLAKAIKNPVEMDNIRKALLPECGLSTCLQAGEQDASFIHFSFPPFGIPQQRWHQW